MAQMNSRYIQFYTPGTAAVKVQVQDEQKWAPLPEPKPEEKKAIYVDPVAILGFAVAVCMLILMAVGITQLNNTRREVAALEHYVAQLTAENHALQETYAAGYDLDTKLYLSFLIMETYYTKKEYKDMENRLKKQLKTAEAKIET